MRPHLFLSLLFLLAGCSVLIRPDPQRAEDYRLQAEQAVARKDFPTATSALRAALWRAPQQGSLYLRQGELLERTGKFRPAQRIYRQGLQAGPEEGDRQLLAWRLSLLQSLRLGNQGQARPALEALPFDSPLRADLLGVLALRGDDPQAALGHFAQALAGNLSEDLAATVYYHAALAHRQLGGETEALEALFQAANRAENLALITDLERLWNDLNADE
ncbi:MAG: hypothetical protein IH614_14505 [Desulfuromonadales bacterium]|nr:hypothetical protein [Desulfuromonadales bacterium]